MMYYHNNTLYYTGTALLLCPSSLVVVFSSIRPAKRVKYDARSHIGRTYIAEQRTAREMSMVLAIFSSWGELFENTSFEKCYNLSKKFGSVIRIVRQMR